MHTQQLSLVSFGYGIIITTCSAYQPIMFIPFKTCPIKFYQHFQIQNIIFDMLINNHAYQLNSNLFVLHNAVNHTPATQENLYQAFERRIIFHSLSNLLSFPRLGNRLELKQVALYSEWRISQ
jgi:hypothetical protein